MSKVISAVILLVCMVAAFCHHADGKSDCQEVLSSLQPCTTYLKHGGSFPATCCDGVKSFYNATATTAVKRSYCECVNSIGVFAGVKPQYASKLAKRCNVSIDDPISFNFNCSRIH